MIADPRQLLLNKKWFSKWLNQHSDSNDDDYKTHAVDILEKWLDEKLPNLRIGNLFRFDNLIEYNRFKERIFSSASFAEKNAKDSRGRPKAALNHYSNYLASFSKGGLKAKLDAEQPSDGRRILRGIIKKTV